MKKRILALCAFFLLVISTSSYAGSASIAGKVSTLGLGGEVEMAITETIGIRTGFNYYTYSFSATEGAINYDFDLNLSSVPIFVDYHPFKSGFRLTGGAIYNSNNFEASANYSGTIDIGGTIYTAAEVGTLTADVDFSSFAPYAGLGWDTTFGDDGGFGFSFDLGAMFQGSPEASFTTTGALSADPGFLADLATEEQELQDALDSFTIYPVVSVGINYRF
ncbi:MAG: hypothetical protein IME98_04710 [Proteobacteria bacterium]|nr:hypothetical protein [Pseudomonadota bacterium]